MQTMTCWHCSLSANKAGCHLTKQEWGLLNQYSSFRYFALNLEVSNLTLVMYWISCSYLSVVMVIPMKCKQDLENQTCNFVISFISIDWTCCHGPHLHAILRIISRGVSGLATDSPCGVWGRGWTTCLLHDSPLFGSHFKMRVGM